MVDFGKLVVLETLSIRGVQWCWDAISKLLQMASEVKHLYMKVEFTGDSETLLPFPEIDFVDFFNSHLKLQTFDIHGAMFAAICQKNSLRNVSPCNSKELSHVMFANPVSCSNEGLLTRFAGVLEVSDTLP